MKNIFKSTFVALALVLSFVSCDNIDLDGFEPNLTRGWVEFENESRTVLSDAGTINIPMEYNVPVNQVDTSVNYTIEVIEGSAPGAAGNFVATVAANTRDLSIDYSVDSSIASNYTLLFTIVSTSNPDVIIGLDGDNPDKFTLEVCANSFPLDWTGTTYFAGDPTDPVGEISFSLQPTENPNEFLIDNCWDDFVADLTGNPDFAGAFVYPGLLVRNADNTITIQRVSDDVNGAGEFRYPGTAVLAEDDPIQNVFDPCARTLSYVLDQNVFNGDFTVGVILSPAN